MTTCEKCGWVIEYGCGCDRPKDVLAAVLSLGLPLPSDDAIIALAKRNDQCNT